MKTATKWVLGCGAAVVACVLACGAGFLGYVATRPRDWTVEQTIEIASPPERISALVADLNSWPDWSVWERDANTEVARQYSDPSSGAGATMRWGKSAADSGKRIEVSTSGPLGIKISRDSSVDDDSAGSGQVVMRSVSDALVEFDTTFEDRLVLSYWSKGLSGDRGGNLNLNLSGRDFTLRSDVRFDPTNGGARVIWREHGDLGSGVSAGLLLLAMRENLTRSHAEIVSYVAGAPETSRRTTEVSTRGMHASRREVLQAAMGLSAAATLGCRSNESRGSGELFSISLAEWSLHRALRSGEMTNLDFPHVARRDYGIDTVEYVNSFFKEEARNETYLTQLRQRCVDEGVTSRLIMIDGEGELAHADAAARKQAVENHYRWIDAAAYLGCMCIRVNAAGSGTHTEQKARATEHQKWAADSLVQLAAYGRPKNIAVVVENHGGLSSNGQWLAGVMKRADDPRVGTLPDFGNFNLGDGTQYNRYEGVLELMPFAKAVSAKSHEFDARGDEVHTDYRKMLRIVLGAGYRGPLGIEYEGDKHSEADGIRLTKALLERVRTELS